MVSASDDEQPVEQLEAFWPEGASAEQRDAHYRAQQWAHVLMWQIDRLYAARKEAMASNERFRQDGFYPDEARWPFMEMDAETLFALVAARQLLRALRAFDDNVRLPSGLTNAQVRDVRDAVEHWDTPSGSEASKRLLQQGADGSKHVWTHAGPGVLGEIVPDAVLRTWAADVYADLGRWDPYDGWPSEV
jgi:AcrR family transcriptional regulator